MLMYMESELCCGWLQCNITTEHGRYGLSCMQKRWSARAVLVLYGMFVNQKSCYWLYKMSVQTHSFICGPSPPLSI